jgi:hypothetical protein
VGGKRERGMDDASCQEGLTKPVQAGEWWGSPSGEQPALAGKNVAQLLGEELTPRSKTQRKCWDCCVLSMLWTFSRGQVIHTVVPIQHNERGHNGQGVVTAWEL